MKAKAVVRKGKPQPKPKQPDFEIDHELRRRTEAEAGEGFGEGSGNPYDWLRGYKSKPRWRNAEAIAALVNGLRDAELEEERYFYTVQQFQLPDVELPAAAMPLVRAMQAQAARAQPPPPTAEERAAMEAAQRGDPEQLARIVEAGRCNPAVARLAAQFIRGERDPRTGKQQRRLEPDPHTGKLRRKRGPSKMAANERRRRNPVHDAADEFESARDMLRALYPEQSATQINDRAEQIAKDRTGTRVSVSNYRNRARGSGQRIR
jgi:hypothetical protein